MHIPLPSSLRGSLSKTHADFIRYSVNGLVESVNSIYKGYRSSSWTYLEGKPNAIVLSETHSKKLVIEDGKATGVEVIGPDGSTYTFSANYEVIMSSGVWETPKLLMLSGVGPKKTLDAFGIETIVDSPHVGQNLLDHPILAHVFKLKDGYGLDHHLLRAGPEHTGAVTAYGRDRSGPYGSGLLELVGFPRIDEQLKTSKEYREYLAKNDGLDPFGPAGTQPHLEIDFVPLFADAFQWHIPTPPTGDYLTVIVDLLRPLSKNGVVTLNSTDPLAPPNVNLNFLSNDLDIVALREGVRWVDDLLRTGDGMKDIIGEDYPWPMPRTSDEAMNKMILERMQTGFRKYDPGKTM
jgi:choline dehydrogenase